MAKYNDIRALADLHAQEISRSPRDWTGYLDTAARLYRYDFADSLLIHAQRPAATACAELETWNNKMSRWVNCGAKGIALIDDSGPRKRLRYVFDISDTHLVMGGRDPWLWQISKSNEKQIAEHLRETYDLDLPENASLNAALMEIAKQYAEANLDEAMDGLEYEVKDTFLEDLGEDAIRYQFRTLMTNSAYYMMAKRCGLEPMEMLEPDDFTPITDFNKLSVLSFLGNAAHEIAEPVLRDIGKEIATIIRENSQEKMQQGLAKRNDKGYNNFSTLKHESENVEQNEGDSKNDTEHGDQLPAEGRLPVPESGGREQSGELRKVWDASQKLPEGEQEELVSEHDAVREAGQLSEGDRPAGQREDGADRGADGESGGRDGEAESRGPDDLGSTDEQPSEQSRRDHPDGIDLQLIDETTEQDMTEAEEEIASALFLPDLPTANTQRRMIEQPMAALYAGEIKISSDVVDEVLRTGSNHARSQLRIIYNYMIEQSPEDYADFVRREYGKGGKGLVIDGREYSVWFDELGMQIAVGHTVEDQLLNKAFLSWDDVSGRIQQLLNQGEYAPQVVLDAARGNALHEHAEALSFMEGDMAEGVAELVFDDMELFPASYPDRIERISEYLSHQENVLDLVDRLEGLTAAYEEDPTVMRFKYYAPDRMLAQFQKFAKEAIPYEAREDFAWNEHEMFITQDEIDAFLARGGAYASSRLATYSFFLNHEDNKERADYIKEQFGTGGSSHALSGADDSHADYGSKGLQLERGNYGDSTWDANYDTIMIEAGETELEQAPKEPEISYFAAENMMFPVMGEYHETDSLAEAVKLFEDDQEGKLTGIGIAIGEGSIPLVQREEGMTKMTDLVSDNPMVQQAFEEAKQHFREGCEMEYHPRDTQELDPVVEQRPVELAPPMPIADLKADIKRDIPGIKTGSKKESILNALRERQARVKEREKLTTEQKNHERKKGEHTL